MAFSELGSIQYRVNPALDILGQTSGEFVNAARLHMPMADALALYRSAYREGALPPTLNTCVAPVVRTHHEFATTKFIQRHADDLETESVVLPYRGSTGRARHTLCVSSQIGCAMGCTFCETAQMGFMRNLTPAQIVGQWWAATHLLPRGDGADSSCPAIDNIVFMGMGEPMENLANVMQAIRVLTDRNAASIAASRISVSTVGRAEGILQLSQFARQPGYRQLRLAVSINAPNDAIRSKIMPINRSTPLAKLMEAMLEWPTDGRQRVLIEYVLIPGVNDGLEHADELCAFLRPLKCTVNVIPYNPRRNSSWAAPTEQAVRAFVQRVHENGQFVKRRQTLGRSVMAACGQLGNENIRHRTVLTSSL